MNRALGRQRTIEIARAAISVVITLVVMLFARPAFTQDVSLSLSAEELKTRGNQAMMELNYAEALSAYRASLAKNPGDVALHYNIGRAHQARGDYVAALDALRQFDEKAPPETKAKVPSLGQLLIDIRAHVVEMDVRCNADLSTGSGTVILGELARLDGCNVTPKRVRASLAAAKSATIDVRLESETHQAIPLKVTVQGGGPPAAVLLVIAPKSTTGILRVQVAPSTAVISVDGVQTGNSPVEITVPAGSHVVDVSADGYETVHTPFVVDLGGRKEMNLTLEKTPPITKRWWFWAGAGAVVAALTTLTVILIVQPERESTSKGTIEPGVIRAPLVTF